MEKDDNQKDISLKSEDIEKLLKPSSLKSDNSGQVEKLKEEEKERVRVINEKILSLDYEILQLKENLNSTNDLLKKNEFLEQLNELNENIRNLNNELISIYSKSKSK